MAKFRVSVPINMSAENIEKTGFHEQFKILFQAYYNLEVIIQPVNENNCEIVFVGEESQTSAVIEALEGFGMKPIFETRNPTPDISH